MIASVPQEVLRKHNDPRRAASPKEAGPASLWHAMQQREDPGSDGSEDSEQAMPLGQESWLEAGTGGLFSSSHAPKRSLAWQHAQSDTAHMHTPRDSLGRQASQQEEESGEEVTERQDAPELGVAEVAAATGAAGRLKSSPVTGPDHSEPSNSMMGNLMSTMRRCAAVVDSLFGYAHEPNIVVCLALHVGCTHSIMHAQGKNNLIAKVKWLVTCELACAAGSLRLAVLWHSCRQACGGPCGMTLTMEGK